MQLIFEFEGTASNISSNTNLTSISELPEKSLKEKQAIVKNRKINTKRICFPLNLHIFKGHDFPPEPSKTLSLDTNIKKLLNKIKFYGKEKNTNLAFPIVKIRSKFINIDGNEKEYKKLITINITSKPEAMEKIIKDAIKRTAIRKKIENP